MAILLSILTQEGVVAAADGGLHRMDQRAGAASGPKFTVISGGITSGLIGAPNLVQRCRRELARVYSTGVFDAERDVNVIIGHLQEAIRSQVLPDLRSAAVGQAIVRDEAERTAVLEALLTFPVHDTCHVFHFDTLGSCWEATADRPWVSAGPAGACADSFLAFLQRAWWKAPVPAMDEALLAAGWIFHHTSQALPGLVQPPFELFTVRPSTDLGWRLDSEDPGHWLQQARSAEGGLTTRIPLE